MTGPAPTNRTNASGRAVPGREDDESDGDREEARRARRGERRTRTPAKLRRLVPPLYGSGRFCGQICGARFSTKYQKTVRDKRNRSRDTGSPIGKISSNLVQSLPDRLQSSVAIDGRRTCAEALHALLAILRALCTLRTQKTKNTRTATASRKTIMMTLTAPAGNVRPVTGIWLVLSSAKGVSATRSVRLGFHEVAQHRRLRPTTAPGHRHVRTPLARGLAPV